MLKPATSQVVQPSSLSQSHAHIHTYTRTLTGAIMAISKPTQLVFPAC